MEFTCSCCGRHFFAEPALSTPKGDLCNKCAPLTGHKPKEPEKGKQVQMLEVQGKYKQLQRQETSKQSQKIVCPRKCKQRTINKQKDGGCTEFNCPELLKKPLASKALGIVTSKKKQKVQRLGKADRKLLLNVTTYGKLQSGFGYREIERPIIKKQLKSLGRQVPRLVNTDKREIRELHKARNIFKELGINKEPKKAWTKAAKPDIDALKLINALRKKMKLEPLNKIIKEVKK